MRPCEKKERKSRARRRDRNATRRGLPGTGGRVGANANYDDEVRSPRWNSCACNLSEDEHRSAELQASFRNNGLPPPLPVLTTRSSDIRAEIRRPGGRRGENYVRHAGTLSRRGEEKRKRKANRNRCVRCIPLGLLARFRGGAPPPPPPRSVMNFKRNRFIISLVPISRDQSPAPQVY